ncbi:MAG: purine-nucleoside phosphorylase, partial [Bacteroidales bacterium]|nr:purine-nucleoside phosphorylase [Bacteroidales bacterium]
MVDKIKETVDFLRNKFSVHPRIAIVLGSGLGGLVDYLKIEQEIPYTEIPNFPISTVRGHKGSLIFGTLNGVEVMVQNGRFHHYEGYDLKTVTFPIRIFKELGVGIVILSNAAGGMNPSFKIGEMMLIRDHINLFGDNPLIGKN